MEEPKVTETIEVNNLFQFVGMLTKWHQSRVAQLEHFLEIPDGTQANLDDDTAVFLEGDVKTAFKIGITLGLNHLGKLPFVAEIEDAPTEEDPPPEAH